MPSVARSYKWFIRIDGNKEDLVERCKTMLGWIDTAKAYGMYHTGQTKENPHCHIVLELTSELQKQTIDTRLKKLFKIEKKSQYSSKVWDGADSAISYMFHEPDFVVVCNKGFTEEYLTKCKQLNESVQQVIQINKDRAPGRAVNKVIDYFTGEKPTRKDIIRKFLDMIREGEMYEPGNFQLEKYMEEVYLKTRPADEWDDYVDERCSKILSRF